MREFALIVAAGLGSSALGGAFGALIGWLSPEFIDALIQGSPVGDQVRFGAAMGLVAGLLLGAAAMGFGLLVAAFRTWVARPAAMAGSATSAQSANGEGITLTRNFKT